LRLSEQGLKDGVLPINLGAMSLNHIESMPMRRLFQYRLRTLLIVAVLVNVAASWFATLAQNARRQRAAVVAVEQDNGWCEYDYECDAQGNTIVPKGDGPGPSWLRRLVGVDFLANVTVVSGGYELGDPDRTLAHLSSLPHVKDLDLVATPLTDTGMAHISGLKRLEKLGLGDTYITDVGLVHVEGLSSLRRLHLSRTAITDAGLAHIASLNDLEHLFLGNTQISDAGLIHLSRLSNLRTLCLNGTRITGAGVKHLQEARKLEHLDLSYTEIREASHSLLELEDGPPTAENWRLEKLEAGRPAARRPSWISLANCGGLGKWNRVRREERFGNS